MRKIQGRVRQASWLDGFVRRFEHSWQTTPRYRAAVSGVAALVFLLVICSCAGITSAVANSVLAGGGGANTQSNNTGTGKLAASTAFPTYTLPPNSYGGVPAVSPIANSQTPAPGVTPTDAPTPSATPTNTPTGGGTLPTTCNGGNNGGTWAFSPCPLVHGQGFTLNVNAPGEGGHSLYVVIDFSAAPSCATLLYPTLDGGGNWSYSGSVPACGANSTIPLNGEIQISGAYTMGINAAPVQ
jgi:hypothetical protein